MRAYQNADRAKANLRRIGRDDDGLARSLGAVRSPSRLVMDADGDFNVDLGNGQTFYAEGARATAERQVAEYLAAPLRFYLGANDVIEDCIELNRLYRDLRGRMAGFAARPEPEAFGGFVVVFGGGLGLHVKLLAERLRFKTMIVVEPHDELLAHSLHVTDWDGLIRDLARDGRDIRFVRGDNAFVQIIKIIRGRNYPFLDGSYFYLHYQAPDLVALAQQLFNQCKAMSMAAGWVEDQLTMMKNNAANFRRPGFRLQRRALASARRRPAFVVGAGPSLDATIEDIRRCRDDVVLISASSGLKVLLEHGLRPDIHCELENGAGLGLVAQDLAARHGGLTDIALYATPTVDPRIAPCFGPVMYFYRANLGSTLFYADGADSTPFAEPTSGNTAVHCALSLGFREIYLFGLDFGARNPDQHHSRHSVYFTYEDEAELATYTPYEFSTAVPGNFGGQVMTGWLLEWGRTSVTNAIRGFGGVRVMNCSDGAQIQLATARPADSIEPAAQPGRPADDVAQAAAELTAALADLSRPADIARLIALLSDFLGDACAHTATIAAGPSPQAAILPAVDAIIARLNRLDQGDAVGQAAFRILAGHVQGGLVAAYHYASRLDPNAAAPGLAAIRAALETSFDRLGPLIAAELAEAST